MLERWLWPVLGTPLAPKLMNALQNCFSEGQGEVPVATKAWGRAAKECPPGKMGKECRRKQRELKKKCPPVEKIKGFIAERWQTTSAFSLNWAGLTVKEMKSPK